MLIPHIVRLPDLTQANLRALYRGSEANIQVKRESEARVPVPEPVTIVNTVVWVLSCRALFFCATKRARYRKYGSAVLAPVI
jgi:hypothetical protein